MTAYLAPKVRKEQILEAAIVCASGQGYTRMTRDSIAAVAQCSPALVSNYFNTMNQLKRAVMRAAVTRKILPIIAQGLAINDEQAKKAPQDVKTAALATLA